MFGAFQRIFGKAEDKPHRFRPAEEFVRKPTPEPDPRAEAPAAVSSQPPRSAYSADVENRARERGATIADVIHEDREAAVAVFGKALAFVRPQEDCLEPREIERHAFWEAEPARFPPLPKERLTHLEGCVLCRSLVAARPSSERAKKIAQMLARADELSEWAPAKNPVEARPVLRPVLAFARSAARFAQSSALSAVRGVPAVAAAAALMLAVYLTLHYLLPGSASKLDMAHISTPEERSHRQEMALQYNDPLSNQEYMLQKDLASFSWYGGSFDFNPNTEIPENDEEDFGEKLKSIALLRKENYAGAKAVLDAAAKAHPQDPSLFVLKGDVYAKQGRWDEALAEYEKAVQVDRGDADAYNARGLAYAQKGEWEKALADYSESLKLDPNNAVAHARRGLVSAKLGKSGEADADFEKSARIEKEAVFRASYEGKIETMTPTSASTPP